MTQPNSATARYADLIADGHSNAEACRIMGRPAKWGTSTFSRMRKQLGAQAR